MKKRRPSSYTAQRGLRLSLKPLNGTIDLEDLAIPSTRERWDYMSKIESGEVGILSRFDFRFPTTIRVSHDGRWFLTAPPIYNTFYEIDPISFKKVDTIDSLFQRTFNSSDYLIRTTDQRLFYGRNEKLESELNPSTLKDVPDQFISASVFPDFRYHRYSGNGQRGKSIFDNKILLRSKNEVCDAMIDIADGNADVADYKATNGTRKMMGMLTYIQKVRDACGNECALKRAMDYVIEETDIPGVYLGSKGDGGPFKHKNLAVGAEPKKDGMQHDGFSHINYGGDERLTVIDTGTAIMYSLLGVIATFSYKQIRA